MNRRVQLVLSVAAIAALTAGCSTFSDDANIARVGDAALTLDDFQAQLTEASVPDDQPLSGDGVRGELGAWVRDQLIASSGAAPVGEEELAALYDAGFPVSGVLCLDALVVADEASATSVSAQLDDNAAFDEVFTTENLDESLVSTGGDLSCVDAEVISANADNEWIQVAAALTGNDPIGSAQLLDQQGIEVAWLVMSFRTFSNLSPTDLDIVAPTIEPAARIIAQAAVSDVFVDPRYGTFDATTGQVVALG